MSTREVDPVLRWTSVAVGVAALLIAAAVVRRELMPPLPQIGGAAEAGSYLEGWESVLEAARFTGDSGQRPTLVEFLDLECPACRLFHEQTLPALFLEFSQGFSHAIVHLPLRNHRFAALAARAAECAAGQGKFDSFITTGLRSQNAFGIESWQSIAARAGVPDTAAFAVCHADERSDSMVIAGAAAARALGFNSTPTIVIDGWHVSPPSPEELQRVMRSLHAGRDPFPR